jgi:PadR family transcriptional regulator AphA
MALDKALLGFLARKPRTGYDLKTRAIDGRASHLWTADQAQIYRTLDRLERDGHVSSELVAQRGRPDRIVYSITPQGTSLLDEWLAAPPTPAPLRDPMMLQFFFSDRSSDEDVLALLRALRAVHQARLDSLRERYTRTAEASPLNAWQARSQAFKLLSLRAVIARSRALVDWADDGIELTAGEGLPPLPMERAGSNRER